MRWFWNRRKMAEEVAQHERQSSIEVVQLKKKSGQTTAQAHRDITRLNDLLKADGITLKIHIATRGGHHSAR